MGISKHTIIHHSADLDGHASGHSIRHLLETQERENEIEIRMIGWDYGQSTEFIQDIILDKENNNFVWISDICLPTPVMIELMGPNHIFPVWIDHHKSSIIESEKHGFSEMSGLRVNGKAACRLVWEFVGEPEPEGIKLLGRYDVFDKTGNWEETQAFQHTIFAQSSKEQWSWDEFFYWGPDKIESAITIGQSLLDYNRATNTTFKDVCFPVEFGGYRFIAKNSGGGSINFCWVTDEIRKADKLDGMMVFKYVPRIGWRFSMYGWEDSPDFSILAKKMGGGGHAHACGFEADPAVMNSIISGE